MKELVLLENMFETCYLHDICKAEGCSEEICQGKGFANENPCTCWSAKESEIESV